MSVLAFSTKGTMSANDTQIAGSHYKGKAIQPWDYIASNDLGYFEGNIVKYVSRWKDKGGIDDLRKAKHYLDKLIELQGQAEHKGIKVTLPTDNGPLWINHNGSAACPIHLDAIIDVRLDDGDEWNNHEASVFNWEKVTSYRLN